MGAHREQLIDLSTPAEDSTDRARTVLGWLRDAGWSHENWRVGDDCAHGSFLADFAETDTAGPRLLERFPEMGDGTLLTVLTTGSSNPVWVAGDGTGLPECPRCGVERGDFDDDDTWLPVKEWLDSGVEPRLDCPACGFTALAGDWDLAGSMAFGRLGIVLYLQGRGFRAGADPDEVTSLLLDGLRAEVGGRWAYVHLHL